MSIKEYFKPSNWFYYLQAKWSKLFMKKSHFDMLHQVSKKSALCPECALAKECLVCGCDFVEMAISNKPCPNNKWK